ncbi:MAG: hypothetical protein HFH15_04235 [Ruminococcus sp.]|nr:hypothetical protein [Ruminococcus sp.]
MRTRQAYLAPKGQSALCRLAFSHCIVENCHHSICDVVGPDEYKEHETDNAFTNYLAVWNIKRAIEYYQGNAGTWD